MTDRLNGGSEKRPKRSPREWCDWANANCDRDDVEWIVRDGRPALAWRKPSRIMLLEDALRKPVMDRRGAPMSESDTLKLNTELESLGAKARYRADGSRYTVKIG